MIFYNEVWDKVHQGREYGYTVKMCADLFGLTSESLKLLLYSKIILPSVSKTLEQTLNREFDTGYSKKYMYIYDNLASKYILWYLNNRFMGLPNYTYPTDKVNMRKYHALKDLTKNKVIVNTIKVEMLIRIRVDYLIRDNELDFLNRADRTLKCRGYMEELKEQANINRELFYDHMGVIRNGSTKDSDTSGSGEFDSLDTSSINFKPSQIIKSKLRYN